MLLLRVFGLYFSACFCNGFGLYITIRESAYQLEDEKMLYTSGLCFKLPFCEFTIETEDK